MDKKIILSILIVALIGIVAATYQIDIDNDTFNPLASVTPEDTPVTDALAAPASDGDSANTAQQQAQAQQQADQANTQQQAQNNSENQGNSTGDSDNTGNTESSGALINSENPVNTPSDGGDSDTGNTGGTSDTNGETSDTNRGTSDTNGETGDTNRGTSDTNGGTGDTRGESQDIITQTPPIPVDPTPFNTGLTLTQSNNLVQKSGLNIVVDYTSVQTTTGNDGVTYYVYLVRYTDAKPGDEPVHLYVSKVDGTMFIYEEGSHADVAPVDESDQTTDTDQSTDTNSTT